MTPKDLTVPRSFDGRISVKGGATTCSIVLVGVVPRPDMSALCRCGTTDGGLRKHFAIGCPSGSGVP